MAGGLNLYGYAAGDPINYDDPFGLCVAVIDCPLTLGAGAWVVGAIAATALGVVVATKWESVRDYVRNAWRGWRVIIALLGQLAGGDPLPPRPDPDRRRPPIQRPKGVTPSKSDSTRQFTTPQSEKNPVDIP